MINITILGSGDAFSQGARFNSAHLIEVNGHKILLDCGPTILVSALKNKIDLHDVSLLAITHLHGDHIAGIPFLLLHLKYISQRSEPLKIIGPIGIFKRIKMLADATYPSIFENLSDYISVEEITLGSTVEIEKKLVIEPFEAIHIPNSFCYQINYNNIIIVYSGDNQFTPELHLNLMKNSDILIHECSFLDTTIGSHTSWDLLKENLSQLMEKKKIIILVHLGIDVQLAEGNLFPTQIIRANDGSEFIFDNDGKLKQMML